MRDFPKHFFLEEVSPEGEPTLQIINPRDTLSGHVKMASDALEYVRHVDPITGKTIILVLAMTAGEYYGPNRNGDGWPEEPLVVGSTTIGPDEVLPQCYKTFETDANVFKHHVNKDPAKSIGEVLRAFYNWAMHRVELLLALDNDRAADIVERINRGEFPAVSMGCRVKYDVCSICGNKAPTRRQYCNHAQDLNGYMPDGRRKFVWNPKAKFFDISMVRRPADRLGFMMKKVAGHLATLSSAELGEYIEKTSQKLANLSKLSVIDKILRGDIAAAKDENGLLRFKEAIAGPAAAAASPLDDETLRQLAQYRPAEMFSSLGAMGVIPSLPEFLKLFIWKLDPSAAVPAQALQNAVASLPAVFNLLGNSPELIDEISSTKFAEVSGDEIRPFLLDKFAYLMDTRSFSEPYLSRRLVPTVFGGANAMAKTAFHGEVRDKHQLRPLLGAGSLMYGTYMLSNAEKTGALDESRAMLSLALNYAGQQKIASVALSDPEIEILASCPFEQVAARLGEVIYP